MFGVSPRTAHLLWITLDIDISGPTGGKRMDAIVLEGALYPRQFKWHMSRHTKNFPSLGRYIPRLYF